MRRNKMFFKIANYYFNANEIEYIKRFPSGANVYLKSGKTVSVADITDSTWDYVDGYVVQPEDFTTMSDSYEEGGL